MAVYEKFLKQLTTFILFLLFFYVNIVNLQIDCSSSTETRDLAYQLILFGIIFYYIIFRIFRWLSLIRDSNDDHLYVCARIRIHIYLKYYIIISFAESYFYVHFY